MHVYPSYRSIGLISYFRLACRTLARHILTCCNETLTTSHISRLPAAHLPSISLPAATKHRTNLIFHAYLPHQSIGLISYYRPTFHILMPRHNIGPITYFTLTCHVLICHIKECASYQVSGSPIDIAFSPDSARFAGLRHRRAISIRSAAANRLTG